MASGGQREDGLTRHLSTLSVLAVVCVVCGLLPVTSPSPDSGTPSDLHLAEVWSSRTRQEVKRDVDFNQSLPEAKLVAGPPRPAKRRVKRQLLYFVLNFLGEEGIRNYVKNTKTENIPSLMTSVGPDEILYIVSVLPGDEIMRVLTALPPKDVLTLAKTLSPPQLMELLSYVPPEGLTNLTKSFSPEELQVLVTLLPPEGIVNVTRAVPPPEARKLLKSLSPGAIFNMTSSMSPKTLVQLMTVLPPDIILDLTTSLSPADLGKLMKTIPLEVMVTLITSLPPDAIKSLLQSLPPGFVEGFVKDITPQQLGGIVGSLTAEQVAKLLESLPAGNFSGVSVLLTPEMLDVVLTSMPDDLLMNLTKLVPPEKLAGLVASIPGKDIVAVTGMISREKMTQLVQSFPPEMASVVIASISPDTLVTLVRSLPVETLVNITVAVASEPKIITEMVNAISPKMVANLENVLPRESVMELLRLLPDETITAIASAIPVSHVAKILKDATGSLNVNLTDIILDIPPSLLVKMVRSVPPEVVANFSAVLTRNQLKKVVHAISPSVLKYLAITLPPEAIVRIVRAIPEQVVSDVLNVLPPKTLTRFIQAVPIETIISYVNVALNTEETRDPHNTLVTFTEHISNILKTLPATLLTKFVKAIPTAAIVEIVDILPKETIAEGASLLSGEEGFPLLSVLPAEAVAHAVTAIPPDCIVKVLDAIPQRTIGSFANMIVGIPTEQVKKFFTLVPVGALKHILTRLPPRTIEKLASSLPPETVEKMAHSVSSTTIEPIMQSFRPGELRRLIRSVSTFTLSKLLSAVPQDLMVNLTQSLPPEQIGKLFSAIPPEIISAVVTHLNPADMVALMKTMPPSIIENMLTTLPTEMMVNMTKILPPDQLQSLMDLLPKSMIGKMIAVLPQDVLVNLVTAFDTDAMLDMMQKLDSTQLIGILSTLPVETVVNLTKSQTPEQTMALLGSLPPDGIMNLTKVFPTDTFLDMLQSLPLEGVMQLMASMPLKDLFALAGQLTPEQMTRVMETFANDPHFLPSMMAKVDFDRIASMVESVPSDLIMQLVSSVDMSKIMGVVKRMMPKVQGLVLKKIEGALDTLARNSTQTFAACLEDVEFVARNLLNFSEWAFKMVDASGKPGRGLLEGNIHMIGNFDQCKGIRHVITQGPRQGDVISGSYCHVQFHIPLEALPPVPGDGILPMPEIAMDVCLPHTCKAVDIHRFLKTFHLPMNVTIPRVACQQDMELAQDGGAIATMLVIAGIVILTIIGTVIDVIFVRKCHPITVNNNEKATQAAKEQDFSLKIYSKGVNCRRTTNGDSAGVDEDGKAREKLLSRTDPESALVHDPAVTGLLMKKSAMETNVDNISINSQKFDSCSHRDKEIVVAQPDDRLWLRVATAFSLPSNLRLLLSTHSFNGSITCLHGIRVLSMLWVSFANSVIFSALNFENLMHAAQDLISLPAQMILNSSLAQDTFFTISGVVTAVTFFTAISSNGGLKITHIIYYYLHRFVRISPAYMLTLLVCTCLLGYTANGPHWPPPLQQQCQEQWWFNMLFINNYFTSIEHMCMSWTWFLANLMQFYWIAPIVLVPLAFGLRVVGLVLMGLLVVVQIVSTVVLEININGDVLRRQSDYLWRIYQQPYCRVAPYALGLAVGFILHQKKFKFPMGKIITCVGWLLTVTITTILTLITYDENRHLLNDATGWSHPVRTAHETLQRPLWALAVCWVIFACASGNGGLINKFFSWRGFVPLSRLTYCVYLIHPVVVIADLMAYRVFAYFTISYVLFRYIGYIVVGYLLALILAVLVQAPLLALEKTIFQKKSAH